MKISVLTMITKPDERQDAWREGLLNYLSFADEVVCVNGGPSLSFDGVKMVERNWPEDWKWEQLAQQLNFGREHCTGDWIIKLDIDQLIHDNQISKLKRFLDNTSEEVDTLKMTKISFVARMAYYAKGSQAMIFRNKPYIGFGFCEDFPQGDLCMPIKIIGMRGEIPSGRKLLTEDTGCHYWNFHYTFKTADVAGPHWSRMARAYRQFYVEHHLGRNDKEAWETFMEDMQVRFMKCKEKAKFTDLPVEIRERIKNLTPDLLGHSLWGLV